MPDSEYLHEIPGAAELVELFGRWPSFHDAEIVSPELKREGESLQKISKFYAGPEPGHSSKSVDTQDAILTFVLEEITGLELYDFNHQNVIFGLTIDRAENAYRSPSTAVTAYRAM